MKLVTEESSMKDLKGLHDQSMTAALAARRAVETNALNLQKQLAERSKLLSQLDNAKMQERMNSALKQMNEISPKGDVPSLAEVRDKIETRYAKALGESEIRTDSVGSKMIEVEKAELDAEAASRLDALRVGLGLAPAAGGSDVSSTVETGQAAAAGTTSETAPQEQVKEGGGDG
jgi:phage shock protein A